MRELAEIEGLRLAEPGEFTRRALENGRLDLAQVEGLADLISAETEAQRRLAIGLMSGVLSDKAMSWRRDLIRARALVEASIDFADEDVPEDVTPEAAGLVAEVLASIRRELAGSAAAQRIREGFEVALVGAPNVGKSTLLNALAGRDVAITSEFAGTTRDVIEVRLNLDGLAVTVLDMAGMRSADDEVERLGVNRAVSRAEGADIRVFLSLPDAPADGFVARRKGDIEVWGKADLALGRTVGMAVSGVSGEGVSALLAAILEELKGRVSGASLAAHLRQEKALRQAEVRLAAAESLIGRGGGDTELVAEELRQALHSLEFLVGRVDLELVLDEVFAQFCLGK
jgi:tRNA modification GTPase